MYIDLIKKDSLGFCRLTFQWWTRTRPRATSTTSQFVASSESNENRQRRRQPTYRNSLSHLFLLGYRVQHVLFEHTGEFTRLWNCQRSCYRRWKWQLHVQYAHQWCARWSSAIQYRQWCSQNSPDNAQQQWVPRGSSDAVTPTLPSFDFLQDYDLDYETEPIYNITVTCVDPIHHDSINKNFSIAVSDVNEAPVELSLTPDTVRWQPYSSRPDHVRRFLTSCQRIHLLDTLSVDYPRLILTFVRKIKHLNIPLLPIRVTCSLSTRIDW